MAEGAVRSGKTHTSLYRFITHCLEGPPGPMMMVGKTIQTVERNVVVPLKDIFPIKYVKGSHIEISGRTVYIVGANDERAEEKIRGSTLAGAYLNEVTLFPRTVFEQIMARCSIAGAKIFGDTNPDSPYHWLKTEYFDNPDATARDLKRFRFKLSDNPILSEQYKESLRRLYTGLWKRRMIDGEWVAAAGAVYDQFDHERHVIPFLPLTFDKVAVGCDYGTASVTTFLAAGRNNGIWFVFREYYYDSRKEFRQKSNDEFADDFLEFLSGVGYADGLGPIAPATVEVDPSATGLKVDLRKRGITQIRNADNDVIEGIRNVADALVADDLRIHEPCINIQQEMSAYTWDEKKQAEGIDEPIKVNDHACFVAGTPIRTEEGETPVESLHSGDHVWTRNGLRPVVHNWVTPEQPVYRLEFSDGRTLTGTGNHPVYVEGKGFVELYALRYGDIMRARIAKQSSSLTSTARHEPVHVVAVRPLGETAEVYNLTVADSPEYFANGVLVHNCDALRYLLKRHYGRPELHVVPKQG